MSVVVNALLCLSLSVSLSQVKWCIWPLEAVKDNRERERNNWRLVGADDINWEHTRRCYPHRRGRAWHYCTDALHHIRYLIPLRCLWSLDSIQVSRETYDLRMRSDEFCLWSPFLQHVGMESHVDRQRYDWDIRNINYFLLYIHIYTYEFLHIYPELIILKEKKA